MADTVIASWSSKGGKWTAELVRMTTWYNLVLRKNGLTYEGAWRPLATFAQDADAIDWAHRLVLDTHDVKMKRTQ